MKNYRFRFKLLLLILFIGVSALAFTTITSENDSGPDYQTELSLTELENSLYGCERGDCCPVPPCPEGLTNSIIIDFYPDENKKAKKKNFIKYETTIDEETGKIRVKKDKGKWKKIKDEKKLKLYFDKKNPNNTNDSTEIFKMVKEEYKGKETTVLITPQSIKLVPLDE